MENVTINTELVIKILTLDVKGKMDVIQNTMFLKNQNNKQYKDQSFFPFHPICFILLRVLIFKLLLTSLLFSVWYLVITGKTGFLMHPTGFYYTPRLSAALSNIAKSID